MDIWIIQDGEKTGPIHDFEVRKKIESGELEGGTPAWHEGLPAWKPLREIELFQREFENPVRDYGDFREDPPDSPHPAPASPAATIPQVLPDAEGPHSVRRFWARWFDLGLYSALWWLVMALVGRDITATLTNPWVLLMHYVPWFVLEAFLIHRFGTTPGKWLLGLKVVNDDGSLLSLGAATHRSSRVLFLGIGFGWDIVCIICQIMSFFTARRLGRPLWDHAAGHKVIATPINPLPLISYIFAFFAAFMIKSIIIIPAAIELRAKNDPEFKRQYEELKKAFENGPPAEKPKNVD
ncbi:MAG: RDD family protein [Akkermansiaceae bacterium]|jgi:uncharacterized RDD family membrane protein YckC|nr:RDD family protein [Akkermansiaceae bacterium]